MNKEMLEALWIVIYSATKTATHGAASPREIHLPTPDGDQPNMLTSNMDAAVKLALSKLGNK